VLLQGRLGDEPYQAGQQPIGDRLVVRIAANYAISRNANDGNIGYEGGRVRACSSSTSLPRQLRSTSALVKWTVAMLNVSFDPT